MKLRRTLIVLIVLSCLRGTSIVDTVRPALFRNTVYVAPAAIPTGGSTAAGTGAVVTTILADAMPGSDWGAKINAAVAALGSTGGIIEFGQPCQAGAWSTPVTLGRQITLQCLKPAIYAVGAERTPR